MIQVVSNSPEQTEEYAEKLGHVLAGGEIIAFSGGLGMGKTCFTRGLAKGLDIADDVSSPTFAIVHQYSGKIPLYHFDMYRITDLDDLYSTGFFDYLDTCAVIAVEWSENIEFALDNEKVIRVEIERGSFDDERILKLYGDEKYENSWN